MERRSKLLGPSVALLALFGTVAFARAQNAALLAGRPVPAATEAAPRSWKPEIFRKDLQSRAVWLSAPEREGRATGGPGAQAAAEWVADFFRKIGLQSFTGGYFQPFTFNSGDQIIPERCAFSLAEPGGEKAFVLARDFQPLAFSENGIVEGEVVFAGYGLSVPEGGGARYNSYDGLEVKDKIVLLLRGVPEGVSAARRLQLNRYGGVRYKAIMARERGAKAVLFVSGPASPNAGELGPLASDGVSAGTDILAAAISATTAGELAVAGGKKLADLQSALDGESAHPETILPGARVRLAVGVEHLKKTDRNVIGLLPPTGEADEYVVVGAHYDHLGRGGAGTSMARTAAEERQIHPGADDNASGTAVVLELAAALKQERERQPAVRRRGVIFALWSGEEIGLIGSAAFVANPPVPLGKIVAYVNFDMVGRLRENRLAVQGTGSSKLWRRLLDPDNAGSGLQLILQDDPYLPTDVTSFYPKRIPVLNFFTGAHEDYHRPSDTVDKLNFEGMERIAALAARIVWDLTASAERPVFARLERSDHASSAGDVSRAYLGTILAEETERGVLLSGVRSGSPAEKGGVRTGDLVVEIGGRKIVGITDFLSAMDAVTIGEAVKISVERGGASVELSVIPEVRR